MKLSTCILVAAIITTVFTWDNMDGMMFQQRGRELGCNRVGMFIRVFTIIIDNLLSEIVLNKMNWELCCKCSKLIVSDVYTLHTSFPNTVVYQSWERFSMDHLHQYLTMFRADVKAVLKQALDETAMRFYYFLSLSSSKSWHHVMAHVSRCWIYWIVSE